VKGPADLVTDADLASQEAIRRVIAERFPSHGFLSEEQACAGLSANSEQLTWIVDPLDGTTNYVHGYPQYCVSVALARRNQILAGVIYDPVNEQCFVAGSGEGAWCNGAPMKTSSVISVEDALVAVSLPARVREDSPDLLDFVAATQVCQAVRRSGSAALNFAYTAKGALDAFWATHIHPWDVAAGVLLVREAGGVVTSRSGGEFNLCSPHFVAAAGGQLHAGVLTMLCPFQTA
jgi:myo-inositol-1(or 4)-monophosphatase